MKVETDFGGDSEYGDYLTIRVWLDDSSWIELEAADAHTYKERGPFANGGKLTLHHADGREDVVWDGTVMPEWYAKRLTKVAATRGVMRSDGPEGTRPVI